MKGRAEKNLIFKNTIVEAKERCQACTSIIY